MIRHVMAEDRPFWLRLDRHLPEEGFARKVRDREGYVLEAVEEAQPPEELLDVPGMADELRRPMMLLVRCRRGGE